MTGRTWVTAFVIAASCVFVSAEEHDEPGEEPRRTDIVERTGRELAQLDVTVTGPDAGVLDLTAEDFELIVNRRPVGELIVDRVCDTTTAIERGSEQAPPTSHAGESVPFDAPPPVGGTYLFYFDQHHLTMEGRASAIENARRMIPELARGGNRALIVSNAERLVTVVEMTDDVERLLDGLDRLEDDRSQWETYPALEEARIQDVVAMVRTHGQSHACSTARFYQLEESFRTDKAMRTLSMVLGLLVDIDPPKVVVYFSDTARARSGEHYFSYAGCRPDPVETRGPSYFGSHHALDRVIHEASANGIRLYTVQAQGLVTGETGTIGGMTGKTGSHNYSTGTPVTNLTRLRQAQDSLVSLAMETGGRPFLNGVSARKMVEAIRDDLGCMYLLSFDPGDLPVDAPLSVLLRLKRPQVKAHVRGLLVLQSESRRQLSRLLSAFALPGSVRTDTPLRGTVVPTGFENGRYTALVQLVAPGSPLPTAEWELGASLVSRGEFGEDASGRITVDRAGVPVVFETTMRFQPGPFELILVGRERASDLLATGRLSGEWPEPGEGPAVGPIALLQPQPAVFVREGEVDRSGALGRPAGDPVRAGKPTAIVGLVCRGSARELRVERLLVGEETTAFPSLEIEFGKDRCAQFRDLIRADTMTPGDFDYEVHIWDGDQELASDHRIFEVTAERDALD